MDCSTRQDVSSAPLHYRLCCIPQGGGGNSGTGGTPSYVLDPPFFFSLKDAPVLFENEYGKLQGPNNSDLPVLDEVNMKVRCRGGVWGRRDTPWFQLRSCRSVSSLHLCCLHLTSSCHLSALPATDITSGHAAVLGLSAGAASQW